MDQIEMKSTTVEEAVEAALRQLGLNKEEVEVEVISKGSRGIFGLGVKPASVRVKAKAGGVLSPEAVGRATDFLVHVVKLMGIDVEVEAKHFGDKLYLEVDQGAGGILIGRRGTTLAALSYLVELIVNRSEEARVKVFVDVAGYLERKRRSLVTLAQEMAQEASHSGREVQCEPMGAFERKVIHATLHNDKMVRTFSHGEGIDRRVVIAPIRPGEAGGEGDGGTREGEDRPVRSAPDRDRQGGRGFQGGRGRREDQGYPADPGALDTEESRGPQGSQGQGRFGRRRGRRGGRGRGGRWQGDGGGGPPSGGDGDFNR